MKKIIKLSAILSFVIAGATGCQKEYLENAPSDEINNQVIFSDVVAAKTAINGIYRVMYNHAPAVGYASGTLHSDFGQKAYDIVADLMGDDMVVHLQGYGWFNRDYQYTEAQLATNNRRSYTIWRYYYTIIYAANNIIANIDKAKGADAESKISKGKLMV